MDYIIIAVLVIIAVIAVLRTVKHFKGVDCCSSGGTIRDKKTLSEPKIGEKTIHIEGMSCENCEIRVENALNRLDNVSCKVSHKKKQAVVSYSAEVSNEVMKAVVEKLGYEVTEII